MKPAPNDPLQAVVESAATALAVNAGAVVTLATSGAGAVGIAAAVGLGPFEFALALAADARNEGPVTRGLRGVREREAASRIDVVAGALTRAVMDRAARGNSNAESLARSLRVIAEALSPADFRATPIQSAPGVVLNFGQRLLAAHQQRAREAITVDQAATGRELVP